MFGQPDQILNSLKIAIASNGFNNQVAQDFGIVKMHLEIPYIDVVKQQIRQGKDKLQKEFASKTNSYNDNLRQSLIIAALGTSKGLIKTESSVIPKMESILSEQGIRNSKKIVAKLINECAQEMIASWFVKAEEIIKKPVSARNELAKMIETAELSFNIPGDEDEEEIKRIEDRLDEAKIIPIKTVETTGPNSSQIQSLVSSFRRR
jgi:hypothetical protein